MVAAKDTNFVPNPAQLRPSSKAHEPQRNINCAFYTSCLNAAAKRGWQDWTCLQCVNGRQREESIRATDFAQDRRER